MLSHLSLGLSLAGGCGGAGPPPPPAAGGGASLRGGAGGISAPIYGALLIVCLSVGMNLQQINGSLQPVVIGAILIFGAALDAFRTRTR